MDAKSENADRPTRWGGSADADGVRRYFTELVALAPPWEDLHELHEPT
jgi:hypothetical protein